MTFLIAAFALSKPIPLDVSGIKGWEAKVSMIWTDPKDPTDKELWEYTERGIISDKKPGSVEIRRKATKNVWGGVDIPLTEDDPIVWTEAWPTRFGSAKPTEKQDDFAQRLIESVTKFSWPESDTSWDKVKIIVKTLTNDAKGSATIWVDEDTAFPNKMEGAWSGMQLPYGDGTPRTLTYKWERTALTQAKGGSAGGTSLPSGG